MPIDFRERGRWLALNVLPHEPMIRGKLRLLGCDDLDVDDIVQEMYARILSVPSLETIDYPKQYALLTAKAVIIDYVRRKRVVSISYTGALESFNIPAIEPDGEHSLEIREEFAAVTDALSQLPEAWRKTLILRRVQGLSQREVAAHLGVSEKAVEKYMANAARVLVNLFGRGGKSRRHSSSQAIKASSADVGKD
jgi:RNA polymerase sigma-70 factor (ECF subfamily)